MDKLMSDLKKQIVEQLNLQDIKPDDIGDDQALFVEGLGLDSIDALELIVLLQQHYDIKLSNAEDGPKVFRTVRTMAEYITAHQAQKVYMGAPVYIAGVGAISAIGNNTRECLASFEKGKAGMADMRYLHSEHANKIPVAEVKLSNKELAAKSGLSSTLSRTALLSAIAA